MVKTHNRGGEGVFWVNLLWYLLQKFRKNEGKKFTNFEQPT
ncbi:hypothetical protein M23134_07056 [Microscilla marina ATCC 23134]|uniref:Uncharacterized protein n=1 Tax=Microscilla marina ATCC 23134 TaxID=313606 RepID=A1ZT71_MICM2|nr:hypothetical protein M23134_07056 [Microscilla marina ATCC 23134]